MSKRVDAQKEAPNCKERIGKKCESEYQTMLCKIHQRRAFGATAEALDCTEDCAQHTSPHANSRPPLHLIK